MNRSGDEGDYGDLLEQVKAITEELRNFRISVEKRFDTLEHKGIDYSSDTIGAGDIDEGQGEINSNRKRSEDRDSVKESYYLAEEIVDELERLRNSVRKNLPAEVRRRMTKSAVAEIALRAGLAELKDERIRNRLVQEFLNPSGRHRDHRGQVKSGD